MKNQTLITFVVDPINVITPLMLPQTYCKKSFLDHSMCNMVVLILFCPNMLPNGTTCLSNLTIGYKKRCVGILGPPCLL